MNQYIYIPSILQIFICHQLKFYVATQNSSQSHQPSSRQPNQLINATNKYQYSHCWVSRNRLLNSQSVIQNANRYHSYHSKLALLFQSELTEENVQSMLIQHYLRGCQIFSIVGNVTKHNRAKSKVLNMVRGFQKESTIMVYGSVILAPTMLQVYYSQSFIQQGYSVKALKVQNYDSINRLAFLANIDVARQKRSLSRNSNIQLGSLKNLLCEQKIKLSAIESDQIQISQTRTLSRHQISLQETKQLFLWFIYKKFKPFKFTICFPLSKKTTIILQFLKKISQSQNIDIKKLVQFVKQNKNQTKEEESLVQFTIFQSFQKMIEKSLTQSIYLFYDGDKLSNLKKILKNSENIYLCMGCIPPNFYQFQQEESNKVIDEFEEQSKFIDNFLAKRVQSIQNFYLDAIKYFRNRVNESFFRKLIEIMKQKMRSNLKTSPFHLYMLKTSFDQIKPLLSELQIKIGLSSSLKNQSIPINVEDDDSSFQKLIKTIKKYVQSQKKGSYTCHICKTILSKKQKGNWGKKCQDCNNFMCYYCYFQKTGRIAKNENECVSCLICSGQCSCSQCKKKTNPVITTFSKLEPDSLSKSFPNFLKQQKQNIIQLRKCQKCFIFNQSSKNIQFQCIYCNQLCCLACQRAAAKPNVKFNYKRPLCSECGFKQARQLQAKSYYFTMLQKQRQMQKQQYAKLAIPKSISNKLESTIIEEEEKEFSQSSHQNGQENVKTIIQQYASYGQNQRNKKNNSSAGSRSPSPKQKKRKNRSDSNDSKKSEEKGSKKLKPNRKLSNSSKNSQTPPNQIVKKINQRKNSSESGQQGQVKNYNQPLWNEGKNKKNWQSRKQNMNNISEDNADDWNIGKGSYNKFNNEDNSQDNRNRGGWNTINILFFFTIFPIIFFIHLKFELIS